MADGAGPFGKRDLIGYAMGDFGCNMCFALVTNYLMLFYTQYIGVKTTDWAWIIMVAKIWDAVNDPIIGGLVDNTRPGKNGKFKPWIAAGSVLLIFFTTAAFLPVTDASYGFKVAFCLAAYMLWSVAYTAANVPYGALHSRITDDPDQRTSLSTFRSIGAGLAQGPLMLLPLVVYDDNDELLGSRFVWIALICSIIGFFGFWLTRTLVTERINISAAKKKFNYLRTIKGFFKNKPMLAATAVTFVQIVCFMSTISVNSIIFQTYFHNTKILAFVNIAAYLPMVVIIFFVGKITRKTGKKRFIVVSSLVSLAAGIIVRLLPLPARAPGSVPIWIIGLTFLFTGNAVFNVVVWAITADCIDYQYETTGSRDEGSLYALYSFFRKLAQGAGASVCALALNACGYKESLGAAQSAQTALNVKNAYLYFMTAGAAITVLIMQFMYNIDEKGSEKTP